MKIVLDDDRLRHLIEVEELQQHRAAEILGVHRDTIGRRCKKLGLKTQRTGPRDGDRHPDWKGGRVLIGGYWHIHRPDHPHARKNRYVAEHRLVMEEKLGRYLLPAEVVHHVDGDPRNNAPDNLMVFRTNAEHLAFDLKGRCPNWSEEGRARLRAATTGPRDLAGITAKLEPEVVRILAAYYRAGGHAATT